MDGLVKFDTRLLLYQALEHGYQQKMFEGSFISELIDQLADITIELATKYFKPIYEDYLITSAYCVIGIANLALIKNSGNNIEQAVAELKQKGFHLIFREGWTMVHNLAELQQIPSGFTIDHLTKELFLELIAEPDTSWTGHQIYQEHLAQAQAMAEIQKLEVFLLETYHLQTNLKRDRFEFDFYKDKRKLYNEHAVETLLLSLLIRNKPKSPITLSEAEKIVSFLNDQEKVKLFKNRLYQFKKMIPPKMVPAYLDKVDQFWESVVKNWVKGLENEKDYQPKLLQTLHLHYDIIISSDQAAEHLLSAQKKELLKDSLEDLLLNLNNDDETLKIASLKVIFEKYGKTLTTANLIKIFDTLDPIFWRGKINWQILKSNNIFKLIDYINLVQEEARESLILLDIFENLIKPDAKKEWRNWPFQYITIIFENIAASREFIMANYQFPAENCNKLHRFPPSLIYLIPLKNWYTMWSNISTLEGIDALDMFLKADKFFNWPQEKVISQLLIGVAQIINEDRERRAKKLEGLNEEKEVLDALKMLLGKEKFNNFKRQLNQKLKKPKAKNKKT